MKKRILSLAIAAVSACTIFGGSLVSAAGWDNNGRRWNCMNGASQYLSSSNFNGSLVSIVNGATKRYSVCGAYWGAMTPQFDKELLGNHKGRTYAQGGGQGTAADGITSSKYQTTYSNVAYSSNAYTPWCSVYGATTLYSGYIYAD